MQLIIDDHQIVPSQYRLHYRANSNKVQTELRQTRTDSSTAASVAGKEDCKVTGTKYPLFLFTYTHVYYK
jgi:hypothetical protein